MKRFILYMILIALCYPAKVDAQEDITLINDNPPLTQLIVGKTIVLLDWILDLKLTKDQENKIGDVIQNAWRTKNNAQIKSTLDVIDVYEQIVKLSEAERNKIKEKMQPELLANLYKEQGDKLAQVVISAYESSHTITQKSMPSEKLQKNNPPKGTGGLTGIYRMLRPKALNINSTMPESGYYIEHITFLPGGYLYWHLPPEGLLYFDAVAAQKAYSNDWATYEIVNDEIHILRGPEKTKYIITRNGERLNNPPSLGKGSFRPIPSADGLRLEGNYRRHETEPTITFTKDGRFSDGGIFRFFGAIGRLDGTSYMDDGIGGSGTYLIEQNTLELKYSDGRIKRFVFEAFPENLVDKPAVNSFLLYEQRLERY